MKKFLAILLSATMLLGSVGLGSVEALYAEKYYQKEVYNLGEFLNNPIRLYNCSREEDYDALIIVNRDSLASDGLSASGLVGATNGLLQPISLEGDISEVEYYLNEYTDYGRKRDIPDNIYIIGGPSAINPKIDVQFRKEGYNVKRIQGKNRIETSYNVAKEIKALKKGNITEMAVTKAYNGEADAISIASEAIRRKMPIILTNGSKLPKESPLGAEVKKIYAIGGPAVIKDSLIKQLRAERIGGKNRYETNAKVIKRFGKHEGCTIVSGDNQDLNESLYASTMDSSCPIVMTKLNASKYIDLISGAKRIFIAHEDVGIDYSISKDFIMASYGKEVFNAYKKIEDIDLGEIGLSRGGLLYNPQNSYFEGTAYNPKDYIIFVTGSDDIDYNIAVSKKNKKVYVMMEGNTEPIDVTYLLDK